MSESCSKTLMKLLRRFLGQKLHWKLLQGTAGTRRKPTWAWKRNWERLSPRIDGKKGNTNRKLHGKWKNTLPISGAVSPFHHSTLLRHPGTSLALNRSLSSAESYPSSPIGAESVGNRDLLLLMQPRY